MKNLGAPCSKSIFLFSCMPFLYLSFIRLKCIWFRKILFAVCWGDCHVLGRRGGNWNQLLVTTKFHSWQNCINNTLYFSFFHFSFETFYAYISDGLVYFRNSLISLEKFCFSVSGLSAVGAFTCIMLIFAGRDLIVISIALSE